MDAVEEIRNAAHLVSLESDKALVDLFGDEGELVRAQLAQEMPSEDIGRFTIGLCIGAQLMATRVERAQAQGDNP